ncbi:MAG: hypothetical protein L6R00_09190 [Phycisphaerae bacterium]|nr:hypothetical protein [Phycisphaerae bacterium]
MNTEPPDGRAVRSLPRADVWVTVAVTVMTATLAAWAAPLGQSSKPRRFAEVEPGALYRGGRASPSALRNVARDHAIRTLLTFTAEPPETPLAQTQRRLVDELHLKYINIPMPGDGRGSFEALDRAADALADASNRPVFFRCAAGKQRTNAALAAYRMRHCGWTFEAALAELDRFGLDREKEAPLCDHLRRYAEERHYAISIPSSAPSAPD